jgi:hypothetical protein
LNKINRDIKIPIVNKVLGKLMKNGNEKKYYQSFFSDIDYPKPSKGKILIYSGVGHMYMTPVEILIYHLLKKEGFEVDYCIYDESIPLNEVITKERVESIGKDKFWNKSVKNARRILNAANVNFITIKVDEKELDSIYSCIGSTLEEIFSFHHDRINFGDIVKGVMYRYYKSLTFGEDAIDIAKKFMRTVLTNYLFVKKKQDDERYDYLLFSHGIYCTWQPVVEFCKANELDFICYDRAKTKGHCNFNLNISSPVWDISETWKRLEKEKLTKEQIDKVDNYLNDRILQKGDAYAYNFSEKEKDNDQLKERLGISPDAKVITVFTNLIWDAANVSRDIAFNSPIHCIQETINFFKKDPKVHIVIRSHPAEKVHGTKERYGNLVRDLFKELPENVTIIEPEDNINSFSVLEISDIGVVHTSTVGLEMAIEGKPVILISDTHYRNKGFTYDAQNKNHYFELLDNQLRDEKLLPNQVKLAKKYFYLMMFEYQHKMPMEFSSNNLFDGYGYSSFEELLQDKNAAINKIISRITEEETLNDFILY